MSARLMKIWVCLVFFWLACANESVPLAFDCLRASSGRGLHVLHSHSVLSSREVEMPNCAIDRSPGRKPCSTRWKLVRLGKGKGLGLGSGLGLGLDPNLQHAVEAAALVEAELHELLEASGG